jgi:hypothetical protein
MALHGGGGPSIVADLVRATKSVALMARGAAQKDTGFQGPARWEWAMVSHLARQFHGPEGMPCTRQPLECRVTPCVRAGRAIQNKALAIPLVLLAGDYQ